MQKKNENLDHKHTHMQTHLHTRSCPVDTLNDNHPLCMLSALIVFIVMMEKFVENVTQNCPSCQPISYTTEFGSTNGEKENKEWNCHNFSECISINPFICYELILFKFIMLSIVNVLFPKSQQSNWKFHAETVAVITFR